MNDKPGSVGHCEEGWERGCLVGVAQLTRPLPGFQVVF